MNDTIDRLAAIDHWRSMIDATDGSDRYDMGFIDGLEFCISDLSTMPSAQPERKTGRWVDGQCSNCGCDIPAYIIDWKWQKDMDANYCPNCGAYMGGEQDE